MFNKAKNNSASPRRAHKPYQALTFTDDYMFCRVLENDMELCRQLLEVVLDTSIREVTLADTQHSISITSDIKSVRLDVYLNDEAGTVFDLEMQTSKKAEMPRRDRYYHSIADIEYLRTGGDYEDLPISYVIFLCTFDPFERGLPRYEFRSLCREDPEIELKDGQRSVYINAKSKTQNVPPELRALLDYMCGSEPASDLTRYIAESIHKAKTNNRWERDYMLFEEKLKEERKEAYEDGRMDGIEQGEIIRAVTVVDNLLGKGFSLEEACDIAAITEEDYRGSRVSPIGI